MAEFTGDKDEAHFARYSTPRSFSAECFSHFHRRRMLHSLFLSFSLPRRVSPLIPLAILSRTIRCCVSLFVFSLICPHLVRIGTRGGTGIQSKAENDEAEITIAAVIKFHVSIAEYCVLRRDCNIITSPDN